MIYLCSDSLDTIGCSAYLKDELQREWKLSGHKMDLLMNDKEAAEFLMENYGHAVLLK